MIDILVHVNGDPLPQSKTAFQLLFPIFVCLLDHTNDDDAFINAKTPFPQSMTMVVFFLNRTNDD